MVFTCFLILETIHSTCNVACQMFHDLLAPFSGRPQNESSARLDPRLLTWVADSLMEMLEISASILAFLVESSDIWVTNAACSLFFAWKCFCFPSSPLPLLRAVLISFQWGLTDSWVHFINGYFPMNSVPFSSCAPDSGHYPSSTVPLDVTSESLRNLLIGSVGIWLAISCSISW